MLLLEVPCSLFTWVICSETDGCPSTGRHGHGVSRRRIHQIEVGGVGRRVIGTESTSDDVEVLSMEMDRMALEEKQRCVLKYDLDRRIVVEYFHPCPHHRQESPGVCSRVIEWVGWVVRKIRGIRIVDLVVICLQHQMLGFRVLFIDHCLWV